MFIVILTAEHKLGLLINFMGSLITLFKLH
jgi:hypothetical protein